jgi:hypothetical protein
MIIIIRYVSTLDGRIIREISRKYTLNKTYLKVRFEVVVVEVVVVAEEMSEGQ